MFIKKSKHKFYNFKGIFFSKSDMNLKSLSFEKHHSFTLTYRFHDLEKEMAWVDAYLFCVNGVLFYVNKFRCYFSFDF